MKLSHIPQRAWINQPSTTQPMHHWHGTLVLATSDSPGMARVYFIKGAMVSASIPAVALSEGWPEHLTDA
jgi:hypothetical protein